MSLIVHIFGNADTPQDNVPFAYIDRLREDFTSVTFRTVSPNADVPIPTDGHLVIMDTVQGITHPCLLTQADLSRISLSPRTTVHDFDLAIQLKLLLKLGKMQRITIFALPVEGEFDYASLQEILRKFVAHDMQGS